MIDTISMIGVVTRFACDFKSTGISLNTSMAPTPSCTSSMSVGTF
ncbi:MAG TPA: hypothetical protein VKI61_15590 [Chitinophagaceae bacterium]|nr:hypothetical protein [Chitinophagaceae bacterium]